MPYKPFTFSGHMSQIEVRSIIDAVPSISKNIERDTLILELMWQSGARVSEVITLVPKRIGVHAVTLTNLKQRKVVLGEDSKPLRDEKDKLVKVSDPDATKEVEVKDTLCTALKNYIKLHHIAPNEWIFKSDDNEEIHVSRWYVWDLVKKCATLANVFKTGKGKKDYVPAYPHLFRHSTAMALLRITGNIKLVKEQLGHSDIRTTEGYANVQTDVRADAVRKLL